MAAFLATALSEIAQGPRPCSVLPGKVGLAVQAALVGCCCLALYVRFRRDTSGRSFPQQLADGSKQMAGAATLHCWNLLGAKYLATLRQGDECANYWLEIMVDTTVGVLVEWGVFLALLALAARLGHSGLAEALGGRAPDFSADLARARGANMSAGLLARQASEARGEKLCRYFGQLAAWLLVVTAMKAIMMCILLMGRPLLEPAAAFILTPFMRNPTVKLVAVMIITPLVMNAVQFWLADGVMVRVQASQAPGGPAPCAAPSAASP